MFDPDFDHSRTPLRRMSTPRPSISPLSVASKANKGSPIATRDAIMTQTELQTEMAKAMDSLGAEVDEQPDDGSSSLSEPDDDQDDIEQQDPTVLSIEDGEQLLAHQSVEVDSEAETERLEDTPKKLRKHTDDVGRTPSKLNQAVAVEDELSEPPSPLPLGAGAASSTSTIGTMNKKRKRSDTVDSSLSSAESDLGEPPRKRSHESPNIPDDEDGTVATTTTEPMTEQIPSHEVVRAAPTPVPIKGVKGRRGRQTGKKGKDTVTELERQATHETAEMDEEASEEATAKTEGQRQKKREATSMYDHVSKKFFAFQEKLLDERLATANAELELLAQPDIQHPEYLRQVACVQARLEKQQREAHAFHYYRLKSIRERTLGDRSQLHSQHFQTIRDQRENVLYHLAEDWHDIQRERRQSHQEKDEAYMYKFPAKKSVQVRQQAKYNQEVSVLSGIAKYVGWPAAPEITATEGDGLEDDLKAMKIPKRVVHHTTTTMPTAAPLQLSQIQQQPTYLTRTLPAAAHQAQPQSDRDAHQQFIEQNAWAQPQRPSIIHHHAHSNGTGTPNLTHTPDWVDTVGVRNPLMRSGNAGGGGRVNTPYSTPLPQKRSLGLGLDGANVSQQDHTTPGINHNDGAAPPSNVLTAPPTTGGERMHMHQHHHHQQRTNSPPPLGVAKTRQNGASGEEVAAGGVRNISNLSHISGASTIDATSSPPDSTEKERRWMASKGALASQSTSGAIINHEGTPSSQQRQMLHQQHSAPNLDPPTPLHHHAHGQPSHEDGARHEHPPTQQGKGREPFLSHQSSSSQANTNAGLGFRSYPLQDHQQRHELSDGAARPGVGPPPAAVAGVSVLRNEGARGG